MLPIKVVDDVTLAFPANVVRSGLLPAMEIIPEEFKRNRPNEWATLFSQLFYTGGVAGKDLYLYPKAGVDHRAAWRQVRACMGSYEPKHEHKEAGVAFMLSEWFTRHEWRDAKDSKGSKVFFPEESKPDTGVGMEQYPI